MPSARELIAAVDNDKRTAIPKGEVKTLLNNCGSRDAVEMPTVKRGDVFWATGVGGKERPWIALKADEKSVVAIAISSGDRSFGMVKSECHYWPSSWIGTTISIFGLDYAVKQVTRPFTNMEQLGQIECRLASLYFGKPVVRVNGRSGETTCQQ